jgi:hypothetical protein
MEMRAGRVAVAFEKVVEEDEERIVCCAASFWDNQVDNVSADV